MSVFTSSRRVDFTLTSDLHKVATSLEDIRRCRNQVLLPDTHSRNLIRLDKYSLIVPGRRVPFSTSRSTTSPASPTVSSCRTLSELSSDRKKWTAVICVSTVPEDLPALLVLDVNFFLKKRWKKIFCLIYVVAQHLICRFCVSDFSEI